MTENISHLHLYLETDLREDAIELYIYAKCMYRTSNKLDKKRGTETGAQIYTFEDAQM